MGRSIFDQPLKQLERWSTGEVIAARKLNRHVDTTNRLQRGVPSPKHNVPIARGKPGEGGGGVRVRRFVFTGRMGDDHLICNDAMAEEPVDILVAKPWLLRRTPFEGEGQERNGIRYTYGTDVDPTDSTERVGLRLSDEFSERQHIRPFYLVDDWITATVMSPADVGILVGETAVVWAEIPSARAWTRMR